MTSDGPSPRLAAIDFSREVQKLTEGFTGREWLLTTIDEWVRGGEERFFLLSGEPGIGKSALAARLLQERQDIVAYHFCIAGRNSTIVPGAVLRSLAAQLGDALPDYGLALANTIKPEFREIKVNIDVKTMTGGEITGVVINNLFATEPQEVLDILLRAPLAAMDEPATGPLLILIDALDEAVTYRGEDNLVRLLAGASDLPAWLRFICTSRPDRRIRRYFETMPVREQAIESASNREDVHRYVSSRVSQEPLVTRLAQAKEITASAFIEHVAQLADGNFLYTQVLLDDVASGDQPLDDLATLPVSLDGVYQRFLSRFTTSEWEDRYQPLFGVLAVAAEPLNEEQLAHFAGLPRTQARQSLNVARQFLDPIADDGQQERFRLFHRSLRDYLVDEERNQDFWCAPEGGHAKIAAYYLKRYQAGWPDCDDYGLRYLVLHLGEAGERQRLGDLLLDYHWLKTKLQRLGTAALLEDFEQSEAVIGADLRRAAHVFRTIAYLLMEDPQQLSTQLLAYLPHKDPYRTLRNEARKQVPGGGLLPLMPSLSSSVPAHLHRQFRGHDARVTALVLLSRRQELVSADDEGLIKIWDVNGSALLRALRGHQGKIKALATSADEKLLASAAPYSQEVIVWDLDAGEAICKLDERALGLAFTSDGATLVTVAPEGLALWDVNARTRQRTVSAAALTEGIDMGSFSAHGDAPAVTIGAAHWLAQEGYALPLLPSVWSDWMMVALFAGCGQGNSAGFYKQAQDATGRLRALPDDVGGGARLTVIAVHAATTAAGDQAGRIYTGAKRRWQAHPAAVTVLALDREATVLASGDERGGLRMWQLGQAPAGATKTVEVASFGLASSGNFALAAADGETDFIYRWPLTRPSSEAPATPPNPVPQEVPLAYARLRALIPDRDMALSAGDGTFIVWQIATGEKVATLACNPTQTRHVAVSADGRFVVVLVAGFDARGPLRGRIARVAAGLGGDRLEHPPETLLCFEVKTGKRRQMIAVDDLSPASPENEPFFRTFSSMGKPLAERLAISGDGAYAALLLSNKSTNMNKGGDYTFTVVYDLSAGVEHARSYEDRLGEFDPVPALAVTEEGRALTAGQAICTRRGVTVRAAKATLSLEAPGRDPTRFPGFLPFARCQLAADGRTLVALDNGGHLHFLRQQSGEPACRS